MRSDSPRVAAASEARRSSGLSTSGKRVSLEAEAAYDSRRSSSLSTSGTDQEDSSRYYNNDPGTLIKNLNKIFLICKEIQKGAIAESYMTNGLLIYELIFAHFLIY
jgi:hypothetical protein